MYTFGEKSTKVLNTLHPMLRLLMNRCIEVIDFSLIEGLRTESVQNGYFEEGKSQLKFPDSCHNMTKDPNIVCSNCYSDAVDLIPYPTGYKNEYQAIYLAGVILGISNSLNIPIRWGGMWDGAKINNEVGQFFDPWHFEIDRKKLGWIQ